MKRHRLRPAETSAQSAARRRGLRAAVIIAILATAVGIYWRNDWHTAVTGRPPAAVERTHQWPDLVDGLATVGFLASVLGVACLGYVAMVADIRAYLRSLRGALVVAASYLPGRPQWARAYTPAAISAFGLTMPCSESELLEAYRARVKQLHPDRGGDRRQFLRLQTQFEEALQFVREQERLS